MSDVLVNGDVPSLPELAFLGIELANALPQGLVMQSGPRPRLYARLDLMASQPADALADTCAAAERRLFGELAAKRAEVLGGAQAQKLRTLIARYHALMGEVNAAGRKVRAAVTTAQQAVADAADAADLTAIEATLQAAQQAQAAVQRHRAMSERAIATARGRLAEDLRQALGQRRAELLAEAQRAAETEGQALLQALARQLPRLELARFAVQTLAPIGALQSGKDIVETGGIGELPAELAVPEVTTPAPLPLPFSRVGVGDSLRDNINFKEKLSALGQGGTPYGQAEAFSDFPKPGEKLSDRRPRLTH